MTPQELVSSIRREVVDRILESYETSLRVPAREASDKRWKEILEGYSTMNEQQRGVVRLVVEQALIDSLSTVLGILDGTTLLEEYRDDFHLSYGSEQQKINGDLQDHFLAAEQGDSLG